MVKVLLKVISVVLFFILLSPIVYAINLGGVVKNKFAEISEDESVRLSMLFWNSEETSYNVKLSVKESPKNWIVIIDPDEFMLNKFIGEEYISLPYTDEVIGAKVVNIFVKSDKNTNPGKYPIIIRAETQVPHNGNGIGVSSERLFEFEIDFKGPKLTNDENGDDIISAFNLKLEETKNNSQNEKNIIYPVVMFLILLSLILLYKKI